MDAKIKINVFRFEYSTLLKLGEDSLHILLLIKIEKNVCSFKISEEILETEYEILQ